jgi:hypothetical protein
MQITEIKYFWILESQIKIISNGFENYQTTKGKLSDDQRKSDDNANCQTTKGSQTIF